MNRDPDFDQTLKDWLNAGADRAPDRYVWAAIEQAERTSQRSARGAPPEGILMTIKSVAPMLGAAAAVVLAVAAYLQFAPGVGTTGPTPTATATPSASLQSSASPESSASPAARLITVADLPDIVLTEERTPIDWEQGGTEEEPSDLVVYPTRSTRATREAAAEIDSVLGGIATEFTGPPDAVYICWAVVFETEADAQRVLAIYEADFTSPRGWGLEHVSTDGPDGQEGAVYEGDTSRFLVDSAGSERVPANIRLWRVNNLLLVLAGFFEYETRGGIHLLGDNMVARARDIGGYPQR